MIKKILPFILVFLFFSCNDKANSDIQTESKLSFENEKETLRYLKEVEWPKAYKEQDTILLDRILGDDFQMVTNDGEWSDKKAQMKRIKETAMNHDSFRYEIKRLEILDNGTAIIAGTGHIINDNIESIYQSSNILIKRNGKWKAVLSHVSGYKSLE
ncbi:nuclear transport factor 2 family protein [Psychroserpens sp. MEBiC05023]